MKLRSYLFLLILAMALPAMLVGALGFVLFYRQARAVVESGLSQTTRALSLAVDHELESSIWALRVLATSTDLTRGDLAAFSRQSGLVLKQQLYWEDIVLFDRQGHAVRTSRAGVESPRSSVGLPEHVREAIATRRPRVSNVVAGPTGRPLLQVAVPVMTAQKVRYVLAASLRLDAVSHLLVEQDIPAGSIGTLLDRNRTTIAHTGQGDRWMTEGESPSVLAGTSERREAPVVTPVQAGERFQTAFRQSALTGWTVVLGMPLGALQGPLARSLWLLGGVGAATLAVGLVIALMLSRRILAPLRALSQAAPALARGQAFEIPRSSVAELNSVGEAMQAAFQDRVRVESENERLFAEAERRRQEAESLAEVTQVVSRSLDPAEVASAVVTAVRGLLRARMAVLYRVDPETRDLVLVAGCGEGVQWSRNLRRGSGAVGLAVKAHQVAMTADVLNDSRIELDAEAQANIERSEYRSVLALPLTVRGEEIGALGIGDVTGRVFSEEEMRLASSFCDQAATAFSNASLYQEIRDAYEKLASAQEQLLQAQKMEAVGRLTGGIAHDFNNLLTVIKGRARLLLDRLPADAPERRHLEIINQTAGRTAELTRQLLAFSRKQVLAPKVLDLSEVVSGMLPMLQQLIGEHIRLTFNPASNLWTTKADQAQLEQIIVNLVVNARDAMPDGGLVTVETGNVELSDVDAESHPDAQPGSFVALTVTDTGVGMDAETLKRIFEPFFTTKGRGNGTGLGLATVYGIVKQSGGHITVSSERGHGTTFRVYLPKTAERRAVDCSAAVQAAGGTETVLVVEDDDEVRHLTREMLAGYGYRILDARDPSEAVRLIVSERQPIDLLLTDVVMPGTNGRALADRLTRLGRGMRVLYMSGYTDDVISQHGVLHPGIAFIAKPFTPDALAEKVRQVLDERVEPAA